MGRLKFIGILFVLLFVVTLACGGGREEPTVAPTSPPAESESEMVEPTAEPTEAEAETEMEAEAEPTEAEAEAEMEAEAEPTEAEAESTEAEVETAEEKTTKEKLDFEGLTDLEQFSSYRIKFVMDFEGQTTGDEPINGHIEGLIERTSEPKAQHLRMDIEGSTVADMGGIDYVDFYEIEGTAYLQVEEGSWMSFPSEEQEAFSEGFFDPGENLELPDMVTRRAETEMVNGISTYHFTFTQEDMEEDTEFDYEELEGDIWVAEEGGYMVKFDITGRGANPVGIEDFGTSFEEGEVHMSYELQDVNEDFTIALPDGADVTDMGGMFSEEEGGPPATDLPMLDDAEEVISMAGLLTYYTASSIEEAADFYRQELPALGWTEDAESSFMSEDGGTLTFIQEDGSSILLILGKEEGRTSVTLSVTEAE